MRETKPEGRYTTLHYRGSGPSPLTLCQTLWCNLYSQTAL